MHGDAHFVLKFLQNDKCEGVESQKYDNMIYIRNDKH